MDDRLMLFMTGLDGGGAERVMLTLAERFAERGCSVDLVVTNLDGPLVDDVPSCVRLVDLKAPRIIASLPALVRYLRKEKPPRMLCAMASANCVALWAKGLARVNTRVVVSEHSTLSIASASAPTWRGRFLPLLMRLTYPNADAVVAVSSGVADDLAQTISLPRERITVIYNPVVSSRMLELSHEPVDHPWFVEGEPPLLLSVGRLTAAKDFATLMRAFAQVRAKRPARLMILGEGEDRGALEQLAAELGVEYDIALPGFVKNPYSYMRNAAVFVLSSRWEGLGNVLIEALACGTPVVSTNCPSGPAEILEDGKWGKLVEPGSPKSLAYGITETLDCDASRAESGINAFRVDSCLDKYLCQLKLN